jgi:hypothetical protein
LRWNRRRRRLTIDAQHHLRVDALQGDGRSRRDSLHERDGDRRTEVLGGQAGYIAAKRYSRDPLVAFVDDELGQVPGILGPDQEGEM